MRRWPAPSKVMRRSRVAREDLLSCSARSIVSICHDCARGHLPRANQLNSSSSFRAARYNWIARAWKRSCSDLAGIFSRRAIAKGHTMFIKTKDGVEIFYKDWGKGQPIVFSHGWPLSADDWDAQMLFFLNHGYRVIAHDRRGHGRSSQVADGHDLDHYADDLAAVTAQLDLKNPIHVGHSTGGGEVIRYLARHGDSGVAKATIISAIPPLMVQTPANPGGLPEI